MPRVSAFVGVVLVVELLVQVAHEMNHELQRFSFGRPSRVGVLESVEETLGLGDHAPTVWAVARLVDLGFRKRNIDLMQRSRFRMIAPVVAGPTCHSGAVEEVARVKGVAAVCGCDPLQHTAPREGTEGVRHYFHLHGLLPRLCFFANEEARLPFDYDRVLALVAPRPALVVAPTLDIATRR